MARGRKHTAQSKAKVALMFRKNKNPEKNGARARKLPFGAYCLRANQ
uniref:Uncharacterized protein n=1 Tax=Candidatus Kentrum sp. SD TaxID=2126332 RepID=A0A450YDA8_9GAMM|nr:MAG: hypothetical protein BECKSD772F_GA0070984_104215 [Candidatus Kentron sp. SD]VFK44695.1 MAG: hypothetical protein BECKSD772E_GA0070983_104216 [Candidatus Kentron sp. SD]